MQQAPLMNMFASATLCGGCNKVIDVRQPCIRHNQDMVYHRQCYACVLCGQTCESPENIGHTEDISNQLVCVTCSTRVKNVRDLDELKGESETHTACLDTNHEMDIEQEVPAIALRCTTCSLHSHTTYSRWHVRVNCCARTRAYTQAGNLYCRACFTCRACARSLFDGFDGEHKIVRYYELLDECYCHDCHLFYKQRLYALQHKGCGPPGRRALDAFMPKRLADSATSIVTIKDAR